jgi:hypothetical protein
MFAPSLVDGPGNVEERPGRAAAMVDAWNAAPDRAAFFFGTFAV